MCVPTLPARSWRRVEQAEPAAGLEGERTALVLSMVWDLWAGEASWLLTASSASSSHPCVLQSWAVRQPSEGSTKMLTVPPDPGCYFLGSLRVSCYTKTALILSTFLRHFLFFFFFSREGNIYPSAAHPCLKYVAGKEIELSIKQIGEEKCTCFGAEHFPASLISAFSQAERPRRAPVWYGLCNKSSLRIEPFMQNSWLPSVILCSLCNSEFWPSTVLASLCPRLLLIEFGGMAEPKFSLHFQDL